ncbi:MAG: NAD(P)H-dependent oxidoreductase subunit E [Acidobacteriota bacterium]
MSFSPEFERKVGDIIREYPNREAILLPLLYMIQSERGFLSKEDELYAAEKAGVSPAWIRGVVTFYTMFQGKEIGKYLIQVCTTLSCFLRGSDSILEHIKQRLGIDVGGTTPDKKFTLVTVECLGSCGTAPVMQINDDYYEDLDIEKVDEILNSLP